MPVAGAKRHTAIHLKKEFNDGWKTAFSRVGGLFDNCLLLCKKARG
jgi:hypothetical protein